MNIRLQLVERDSIQLRVSQEGVLIDAMDVRRPELDFVRDGADILKRKLHDPVDDTWADVTVGDRLTDSSEVVRLQMFWKKVHALHLEHLRLFNMKPELDGSDVPEHRARGDRFLVEVPRHFRSGFPNDLDEPRAIFKLPISPWITIVRGFVRNPEVVEGDRFQVEILEQSLIRCGRRIRRKNLRFHRRDENLGGVLVLGRSLELDRTYRTR
jgi:hypothetical protein